LTELDRESDSGAQLGCIDRQVPRAPFQVVTQAPRDLGDELLDGDLEVAAQDSEQVLTIELLPVRAATARHQAAGFRRQC
jgi:hypothetical protein